MIGGCGFHASFNLRHSRHSSPAPVVRHSVAGKPQRTKALRGLRRWRNVFLQRDTPAHGWFVLFNVKRLAAERDQI